jgi:hypothetical protein
VNNPHKLDELKDNIQVEIYDITRELRRVAGNIFSRREACLQAEGRHFEILLQDTVGFVSGKPAGSFSVSGPAAKRPLQCRKPASILKGHSVVYKAQFSNSRYAFRKQGWLTEQGTSSFTPRMAPPLVSCLGGWLASPFQS